ncbi:MAG TPA: YiiX/YebB-like N1pC/P60 family cysteine hydrolase, partial [Candidatus Berkiella sp.]|nr:YiiX/YebB-like N1pC/P60 family cysteine hydrolase [Candidatus Berkiella sp.]
KVGHWLLKNEPPRRAYLCDYLQISNEVKPGDVLLIEGRNRVSRIIQQITRSPWSHAALYAGRLGDIQGQHLQETIKTFHHYSDDTQLLIETEVGEGTIASPLSKYEHDHIRILRPQGLDNSDVQRVIAFAVGRLGRKYDMRHIFDLARFLFPCWRSSLFQHNALQPTEDICSSMIADAFHSVDFPILPLVKLDEEHNLELIQRNPRLFTPSDFDYSPYFNVIKYPIFKLSKDYTPHQLPWKRDEISNS